MLRVSAGALTFALVLTLQIAAAHAQDSVERSGFTSYTARGVDSSLPDLPGRMLDGSMEYDESYFSGLSYQHGTRTPNLLKRLFRFVHLDGTTTGVEFTGIKHRGLQDHFESSVAYQLTSPYATLGPLRSRLGYSLGLSYAHGTPIYERAPDGSHDRLMTYMAYELELGLRRFERVSLVGRVHHRSGAYGLFAPRGSGSNFLAVGLRVHW